jgi:hypothetical protein
MKKRWKLGYGFAERGGEEVDKSGKTQSFRGGREKIRIRMFCER